MKYCSIEKLQAEKKAGKWWEKVDEKKEGQKKWSTLRHNGMYFPPPYEPLPKNIQILYKRKPIKLDSKNTRNKFNMSAEEAMLYFAQMVDRDERLKDNHKRHRYSDDAKFRQNFWKDWKKILGSSHTIKNLDDVDFTPVAQYLFEKSEQKKTANKAKSKEMKEEEKKQKKAIEDLYGYALVDGAKIPIDYTVEIPGLYQGHGKHPLRGKIKKRLQPSDITLNVSKKFVPKCISHGKPCKWGKIVENHDVTWIAGWRNPITEKMTYKWIKRIESHFVCAGDMMKFEKARKLDKNIEKVREKYTKDLGSSSSEKQQHAAAVYLLDKLAIRPGTDKDESKEAGTLGLTTLKCQNVTFNSGDNLTIDFVGKSSISFKKKFKVDSKVYNILKNICRNKGKKAELFPRISANSLNEYLKTLLPDLTAKVFRTWKASSILQKELSKKIPKVFDETYQKKLVYDRVNIEVAKALNHKRMTSNDARIEKINEKIKEFRGKLKDANTDSKKKSAKKSIESWTAKLEEAEGNIALSTSKVNYLDPRISVAWAKQAECPIEKIYNKTQLKKFVWAMDTKPDWKF